MKLIIAPAKKMRVDRDTLPWRDLPRFLDRSEVIYRQLQSMSYEQLKALWKCNDQIAALNLDRLARSDLRRDLTPAILAYEGTQYQYMAPGVFTQAAFDYTQDHLRILSGLYGVLRPFDGVIPYRLEMQAKLKIGQAKDLYSYWGSSIADELYRETDCVVDLASKEYSRCVTQHRPAGTRWITCVFGELAGGRVVEKGTLCKMARGEMVRFLSEQGVDSPEGIKDFQGLDYTFSPAHSDGETYTFLLQPKEGSRCG